ncbi:MAG: serine/threonine protein kinase [Anaerolineae bacterium]|nr:serine/threonine protein kinase [Anaerolineae bacterium]
MSFTSLLGNRYQIQATLGTGGMSIVYQARDLMLERPVAIKVLRQDFSKDSAFRERFRQEAKAAANLSHPNIVTVHDFGFDSGRLFIVMEYIPGKDLKSLIKEHGRYTPEEALPLIIQACAGIGYAHRAGLVHCDVKPHNMLVTPDRRLKVTDFGIARALSTIKPDEKSDIVWGSPQYFSPEQAAGLAPSPASDVYSLGVILYEMLTGKLPFHSDSPSELARMHRDVPPIPPRRLNPEISPELEQILFKTLSKEPSLRYRTADQMGRILVSFSRLPETLDTIIPDFPSAFPTTPRPAVQPPQKQTVYTRVPSSSPPPVHHTHPAAAPKQEELDWLTIGLGLVALLAVGGLVPLWLTVFLRLRSLN